MFSVGDRVKVIQCDTDWLFEGSGISNPIAPGAVGEVVEVYGGKFFNFECSFPYPDDAYYKTLYSADEKYFCAMAAHELTLVKD